MNILIVLSFISLVLVGLALLSFLYSVRSGDQDHAERLSLLPLETDEPPEKKE
ncbi:MAG: cbb3-type cytochrome oxidase assembly protein CcoS [Deltaproteobacteria bacterium]|nr:cbb3-type cytochrome oxidase assembly protein CcoS [Deltaproteobacteria bacterium]